MAKTSPVRADERGLYVINNGQRHRPGGVAGYDHVYRMDAHTLSKGDRVHVRNVNQSPLCRVTCADGVELRWATAYELDREN